MGRKTINVLSLLAAWFACAWLTRAGAIELEFTRVAELTGVVDIRNAGDGRHRLFLVEQSGRVFILANGELRHSPFLDIRDRVVAGGERGLLSVAFAPDYASSGYFYAWYTGAGGDSVLSRFRVSPDPEAADPGSEQILLQVDQPYGNHNGGRLVFGPDGMLYLGLGDGGGAGDPLESGQSGSTLLGKIIRIDVHPSHGSYAPPADNPFVGEEEMLDEIWALGVRNPWRISFDRLTGDLYIADVGQGAREEIDVQPAASPGGENYGWNIMEGSLCASGSGCDQEGLTLPVAEYSHQLGCSVTGGEVYRGGSYPALQGTYLYGDYCSGRIWGLSRDGGGWRVTELADTDFAITTFGEDEAGNVYLNAAGDGVYLVSDGPARNFYINAGLNDAWYDPMKPGQGFFIVVFPLLGKMFAGVFTYDTERPGAGATAILGEPGHRWFTAFGDYAGREAALTIEFTRGGVFDAPQPAVTQAIDGTLTLVFYGCNAATVRYHVESLGLQGTIPIQRLAPDNRSLCELLAAD